MATTPNSKAIAPRQSPSGIYLPDPACRAFLSLESSGAGSHSDNCHRRNHRRVLPEAVDKTALFLFPAKLQVLSFRTWMVVGHNTIRLVLSPPCGTAYR